MRQGRGAVTGTSGAVHEGLSVARARAQAADGALVALALVGAVALVRMVEGGLGGGAAGPLLVTAAVGSVVPGALVQRRVQAPLAAAIGAVLVALAAMWTGVPGATRDGVPTATTLRVLRVDIRAARADLSGFRPPLHASPGVVLLGALLAGMAAVAARVTFGDASTRRRRFPAGALVPSAALVTWSAVAAPSAWSAVLVAALIAASAAVVALATPSPTRASSDPGDAPPPMRRRLLGGPVTLALMAMIVAVVVGVTAGSPSGASTVSSGSAIAGGVPATGLSLASDLLGLERRDPSVVLFWARSPVPTYWQVGILSTYLDGRWTTDQSTQAALAGRSAGQTTAQGLPASPQHSFSVTVTVRDLSSRLLPVPPDTTSVVVPGGAAVTALGAVAAVPSALDERYQATAIVAPAVSAVPTSTTGGLGAGQLSPYVTLPAIPAAISDLARQVTSMATTPLARAEALVDWFRSGLFHYTLTPPPIPTGADPLVAFLTDTRAGTCESFAGAFAVMARSVGLPTRIAVGFTGGRSASGGLTIVRGADAHEWPEVYLGAGFGWVSFEPTPELPSGELSPPSVVGPTGIQLPTTIPPAATSVPPALSTVPTAPPTTAPSAVTRGPSSRRSTASSAPTLWLLVASGAVVLVAGAVVLARWRRRERLRAATASQRVLWAYGRAERGLRRAGITRPAWRPPPAHARALLADALEARDTWTPDALRVATGDELVAALRDLLALAEVLERGAYGGRLPTPQDVSEADEAAGRVRRTFRRRPVRALAIQMTTRGGREPVASSR
jgi:transglutaminase-like putative cysteine protease